MWRELASRSTRSCAALTASSCRCASTRSARSARKTVPAPSAGASSLPKRRETLGRLTYDASKAGLQKVDKATVQATIDELSKDSAFYKSEQKKAADRDVRIAGVVARAKAYSALSADAKKTYMDKADALEAALEAERDLSRCFLHVDMDMFYAAVEERQDPSLRDRPFAVGSYAMLTTSNYIARQYGVRSGMPGFIAKKLCPDLWIVPTNFDLYEQDAVIIRSIAATYDPTYVSVGLDEVTMDITDYMETVNAHRKRQRKAALTPAEVGAAFRADVFKQTGLTCSGGISSTAAFAKMASNVNKPNGQHEMVLRTRAEVLAAIQRMPIRGVPGIGGYTEALLHGLGIRTCADMHTHRDLVCFLFKDKTATFYLSVGLGTVRTHVDRTKAERAGTGDKPAKVKAPVSSMGTLLASPLPKSISKSRTFARGFKTREQMLSALQGLTVQVHDAMLQHRARASTVVFFTTSRAFASTSHTITLEKPSTNYAEILRAVTTLATPALDAFAEGRLIGVRVTKLERGPAPRARHVVKRLAASAQVVSPPSVPAVVRRRPARKPKAPATKRTVV